METFKILLHVGMCWTPKTCEFSLIVHCIQKSVYTVYEEFGVGDNF